MKMKAIKFGLGACAVALSAAGLATSAQAKPVELTADQMDSVAAAGVNKVAGFVCPVIKTSAVLHSPRAVAIGGGDYAIIGPDVSIPIHATNGNGAGRPGGAHSSPGDTDYTAIWLKV